MLKRGPYVEDLAMARSLNLHSVHRAQISESMSQEAPGQNSYPTLYHLQFHFIPRIKFSTAIYTSPILAALFRNTLEDLWTI
jgi:hypothetical protein